MAGTTLTIALMLTAYNNMKGALSSAEAGVKSLGTTFNSMQSKVSSTTVQLEKARKELDKWESRGMAQITSGAIMAAPFISAVKAAGNFQDVLQELKIVTYDSTMPLYEWEKQAKALAEHAKQMGMATRFNATEAGQGYLMLAKGGVLARDILEGTGEATVKLAQASGMLPAQVAESMVKVGNAYSIQGKEMLTLADFMSRVDNASTASLYSLTEGYKYASAAAAQLGVSYKDTGLALAVLNNRGLDGTTAGTNLADMLRRLTPLTRISAQAMKELGFSTADVANIKRGASRIGLAGQDLFHDESGKLKPMVEIIQTLRRQTQGLRADVVQVAFTEMFGVEGARAALALVKEGSGSWEEVAQATGRAMGLNERISLQQATFNAQLEQLRESWNTLLVSGGTPLLSVLTSSVGYAQELVGKFITFNESHPEIIRWLAYGIGAMVGFNIVVGAARVGLSIFGKNVLSVFGFAMRFGSGIMRAGKEVIGLWNTFQYFRQGAGIFRSIWSAIAFGSPVLTRVGLMVTRLATSISKGALLALQFGGRLLWLGAQALVAAARLATAWLIGLGPIGWIIGGITAVVAVAIAAWRNNFLGFRDHVIAVWDAVINKVKGAIDWFKGAWDWVKGVLHLSSQRPGTDIEVGDVPAYASGGFVTRPHLGLIGEAGPEAIIPLGRYYRARALELYSRVGALLGIRPYFAGGIVVSDGYGPPVSRMVASYQDNRQYYIYISNPNPVAAAREVAKMTGGMDKYARSRDPRLQDCDFALAGVR